jgi:hypothetical protein
MISATPTPKDMFYFLIFCSLFETLWRTEKLDGNTADARIRRKHPFFYNLPLPYLKPHTSDFRSKANILGRAELLAWVAPLVTQLTEF